jgi:hypothetical protein
MGSAQEMSQASWRKLEDDWGHARDGWNDGTTDHFEAHFWSMIESEVKAYQVALATLMETFSEAQAAISDR